MSVAHFTLFSTPLGDCAIAWRGDKICGSHLPEATPDLTASKIAKRAGAAAVTSPPDFVQVAIEDILQLLSGQPNDLTGIDLDFSNIEPFASKVYHLSRAIKPGQTKTYGDLARDLGDKSYAQAVGRALGANPFPIIIPCHRILGVGGKLTGFSAGGGLSTKLKLLEIEKAQIGDVPSLFGELPLAVKT
ncbi:MAG: methylated-DNA--[protein]-cysteine S-methyltransferase [Rhizobiaceae bacterium]